MGLKERSNFDSAYFDRCNNAKPKPETEFINELVDVLMKDIKHPLTIKGIKANLKNVISDLCSRSNSEAYALVVDSCEKRQKLLSVFLAKMMELEIHINTDAEEIITQVLHVFYQFILFNVDSFFSRIDEIFEYIRADNSKNKDTPLYLITSNKSNFEQLKLKSFDDNTFVLEPFNPKQIALILRRFEILYVDRRFFNRNNNNAG
jgi:CheY-like chemotaxis protein